MNAPTSAPASPVALGSVLAERYRVEAVLGEGGMGVVVRATHLLLQQQVAIKFLRGRDPESVNQLLREARAAAKVQSDHVVRISDVAALADGTPYIVMEYLEGTDLANMLAAGPLHFSEAVRYGVQICDALTQTHNAGIVHGDLKPENIYITRTAEGAGKVKLLDFGISRAAMEGASEVTMGTPEYMAPEQFSDGIVEPRTDLWALGILLYEMLNGAPPFQAPTVDALSARIAREPVPPIVRNHVPPGFFERVIARCLEKQPQNRFPNPVELAIALEEFSPMETTAMRLARQIRQPRISSQKFVPTVVVSKKKSSVGVWIAAGLFVFLALVGAVLIVVSRKKPTAPTVTAVAAAAASTTTSAAAAAAMSSTAVPPSEPASPAASASAVKAKPHHAGPKKPPEEGDRFGTRK